MRKRVNGAYTLAWIEHEHLAHQIDGIVVDLAFRREKLLEWHACKRREVFVGVIGS